ncbi:YcjX family protein [Marinobacterium sp. YM272]|uniref:YcjX family protein n=1 Tax=Marinobacterium sp. YM272 TaxID=3421654 RepID=UPI003D7F311A
MSVGSKLKRWIGEERVEIARERLGDIAEQSLERHLRLAVTGLSQSGKTIFITSLVHHLLHAHRSGSLPFFEVAASGRIISSRDLSATSAHPFPFNQALAGLSQDPPRWPQSTTGLSEVRLAIRYRRPPGLRRLLGETGTLYLDIVDYPGEWLLDLPLMELSFEQWCEQQKRLFAQAPRASVADGWLAQLQQIDWLAPADAAVLQRLSNAFTEILQQLRSGPDGLSLLQPGRCVLPGEHAGSELLVLFPLVLDHWPAGEVPENSYLDLLQRRYDQYCEQIVKPFYTRHFSRFDRQVVLVDCLKTLNRGEACFEDMKEALSAILQSFNYGRSGFLRRLFSPRIDRVLFASTKGDHVTANQHHNLDRFLELIVEESQRNIRFDGIETRSLALSSVRSTQAAQATVDGQQLSCLRGLRKDTGEEVALFPGEVPTELPGPNDWSDERFRFIDFAPRRLPLNELQAKHHIRLDQVLEYMTGDLFR